MNLKEKETTKHFISDILDYAIYDESLEGFTFSEVVKLISKEEYMELCKIAKVNPCEYELSKIKR